MKKSYIVWVIINNKEKILTDMTPFYFDKRYADQMIYLMKGDRSMKDKPYKVKKAYLSFNK